MSKATSAQASLTKDPNDNNPFNRKQQMAMPGESGKDPDGDSRVPKDIGYNPLLSAKVAGVLKEISETAEIAKKSPKLDIGPNLIRAKTELGRALKKIEARRSGYTEWESNEVSRIFRKLYGTAKNVANHFSANEPFDSREYVRRVAGSERLIDVDIEYASDLVRLDSLVKKGFLESRTVYTEKGKKEEYRMTARGLDMLQMQAIAAAKMRRV